jgi:MtN3 and saliva related transmembrane protein
MINVSTIGLIAALLTTAAYIPQAYKTIRTRSTKDLSIITFSMLFFGTILWFIYGLYIHDTPLMLANGITAALSGIIFSLKIKSMGKRRRR